MRFSFLLYTRYVSTKGQLYPCPTPLQGPPSWPIVTAYTPHVISLHTPNIQATDPDNHPRQTVVSASCSIRSMRKTCAYCYLCIPSVAVGRRDVLASETLVVVTTVWTFVHASDKTRWKGTGTYNCSISKLPLCFCTMASQVSPSLIRWKVWPVLVPRSMLVNRS